MVKQTIEEYVNATCGELSLPERQFIVRRLSKMAQGWARLTDDDESSRVTYLRKSHHDIARECGVLPRDYRLDLVCSTKKKPVDSIHVEVESYLKIFTKELPRPTIGKAEELTPFYEIEGMDSSTPGMVAIHARVRTYGVKERGLRRVANYTGRRSRLPLAKIGYEQLGLFES
jgi:hypothetical protein